MAITSKEKTAKSTPSVKEAPATTKAATAAPKTFTAKPAVQEAKDFTSDITSLVAQIRL